MAKNQPSSLAYLCLRFRHRINNELGPYLSADNYLLSAYLLVGKTMKMIGLLLHPSTIYQDVVHEQ